ncbi:MAG: biosynthetic arginine decarboxylase [Spirulinaceae cyanobacterium SM2_1_0]|nr:biosynthetic arginine decarboxylase [Spirulinaceae cyanobacterium SM2_1_0]
MMPALPTPNLTNLTSPKTWSRDASEALYRLPGWGEPYFSIDSAGRILVSPQGDRGGSLDLYNLVEALRQRNLGLPLLIRFSDILTDRIERLNACFARAIARYNYSNCYRGVYPIKCNPHSHLVAAVVNSGQPYQFGLEAGSKPELAIALASLAQITDPDRHTLLICNGYKDREYVETALLATRLGHQPLLIIEQLDELPLVLAVSQELGIAPTLGLRAKLNARGTGRWGDSTGDRAKFGLSVPALLAAVEQLRAAGQLDCLQLLHFHIGSQIAAIGAIKDAIREAAQIYGELVKLGAPMQYLDVGGGLAVDYDGSKSNFYASKNYNLQNYANDIVAEVKEACEERQIAPPILISESGRAIAAHQAVLVFDILGCSQPPTEPPAAVAQDAHLVVRNLWDTYRAIAPENIQETYHDAIQFKDEAVNLFNFGYLSLAERAQAEQLYWACCREIWQLVRQKDDIPDDLAELEQKLAAIYYANLSIFQSAPDAWAIDQLFPVVPIHRLNEEPTARGILADLTCDSDGKLDRFIHRRGVKRVLELHPLRAGEPYYLGLFLVGAYQEIVGNLHNLFGDTNVVHIQMQPQGYEIEHVVKGDTIAEVLAYAQYNADDLLENLRRSTERALQTRRITLAESQRLLQTYERSLSSYTYLKPEQPEAR